MLIPDWSTAWANFQVEHVLLQILNDSSEANISVMLQAGGKVGIRSVWVPIMLLPLFRGFHRKQCPFFFIDHQAQKNHWIHAT